MHYPDDKSLVDLSKQFYGVCSLLEAKRKHAKESDTHTNFCYFAREDLLPFCISSAPYLVYDTARVL